MAEFPTLLTRCTACRGRGIVAAGDAMALCPNCGGSARAPIKVKRVPFDYSFPLIAFGGAGFTNGQLTLQLQLDDDSYFEQTHLLLASNMAATGNNRTWSLQLSDQSSGWQFSNAPLFRDTFARIALVPWPLVVPYIWKPSTSALITLTIAAPGNQEIPQITMKGFKLFAPDGSALPVAA